jgi:Protein of unknown function (DUF1573)
MSKWRGRIIWAAWTRQAASVMLAIACIHSAPQTTIAQGGTPQTQPPSGPLRFEPASLRLGEIRSGVPLSCQFTFVNTGPHSVELVEARPGCGCLKPRFEQRVFSAGQQGIIPLEIQTLGQPAGPHTWQMTVVYREGEHLHEQALQVIATVVTEISVQPASLLLLAEGAMTHMVTVTDLRAEPLRISSVETTAPFLHAEPGPFAKDEFGNFTCKIKVQIDSKTPVGRHDELLVIHTSDPIYPEFKIPITVVKRAGQI